MYFLKHGQEQVNIRYVNLIYDDLYVLSKYIFDILLYDYNNNS